MTAVSFNGKFSFIDLPAPAILFKNLIKQIGLLSFFLQSKNFATIIYAEKQANKTQMDFLWHPNNLINGL